MGEGPDWASEEIDHTRPSVARVYDFYLGGSHNFESDRAFGRQALERMPDLPTVLRDNRAFLRRAVAHLSGLGIDQFLDLGSGIPTVGNVHEVAQGVDPSARVVYVDHDPVAVAHSRALLKDDPNATIVAGDLREPRAVLDDAVRTGLVDLGRPLAVLMVSVLHFVLDSDRPREIVRDYMAATVPGSHVAVSHARLDGRSALRQVGKVYDREDSPNPMRLRTAAEVEEILGDLAIVPPGVTLMPLWHPDPGDDADVPQDYPGLAAVARRD
ncbi:SAM-dependent methyltransferase [Pseudonocardia ailaonensis]|uniref:SAM-dependent methyltransferase n=1 Tax=Pseudonocardia ailaonensis TaxID=367279 RepID=A0ABN2MZL4_9PSEU